MGIIMEHEGGCVYGVQCEGVGCDYRRLEGYFVPLVDDTGYLSEIAHGAGTGMCCASRIVEAAAVAIDGWLREYGFEVDRERLGQSTEAWVWVKVKPDAEEWMIAHGLPAGAGGVLVWWNCD